LSQYVFFVDAICFSQLKSGLLNIQMNIQSIYLCVLWGLWIFTTCSRH